MILTKQGMAPVLGVGDLCMLLGQSGPFKGTGSDTSVYQVTGIELSPLLGQHGAIIIWSQANAAPAGYKLDATPATGTINAGAQTTATPTSLVLDNKQLLQVRLIAKFLGTKPAGFVEDDYDVLVNLPGANPRWGVKNAVGVLNNMAQFALPGDTADLPAQGANLGFPSSLAAYDPFDAAWASELFIYEQQTPQFVIQNNGSVALNSGNIALMVRAIRYDLFPVHPTAGWNEDTLGGQSVLLPPGRHLTDIPVVQIAQRQPVAR